MSFWRRKEKIPKRKSYQAPQQKPKKTGCKFKYKKKADGYEVSFSPECRPEERAEIMRHMRESEGDEVEG